MVVDRTGQRPSPAVLERVGAGLILFGTFRGIFPFVWIHSAFFRRIVTIGSRARRMETTTSWSITSLARGAPALPVVGWGWCVVGWGCGCWLFVGGVPSLADGVGLLFVFSWWCWCC
jgi:hypothetical protein